MVAYNDKLRNGSLPNPGVPRNRRLITGLHPSHDVFSNLRVANEWHNASAYNGRRRRRGGDLFMRRGVARNRAALLL